MHLQEDRLTVDHTLREVGTRAGLDAGQAHRSGTLIIRATLKVRAVIALPRKQADSAPLPQYLNLATDSARRLQALQIFTAGT